MTSFFRFILNITIFLNFSIPSQTLQCLLKGSVSRIFPFLIDMAVTTPLSEEYPLRCHVPSTDTPVLTIPSELFTSLAASAIDCSATILVAFLILVEMLLYVVLDIGFGIFIKPVNFSMPA